MDHWNAKSDKKQKGRNQPTDVGLSKMLYYQIHIKVKFFDK